MKRNSNTNFKAAFKIIKNNKKNTYSKNNSDKMIKIRTISNTLSNKLLKCLKSWTQKLRNKKIKWKKRNNKWSLQIILHISNLLKFKVSFIPFTRITKMPTYLPFIRFPQIIIFLILLFLPKEISPPRTS